jgi:hypothetical protein
VKSTYIDKNGKRTCRFCRSLNTRQHRERNGQTKPSVCRNGHPRTDDNTYHRADGSRECRICMRRRDLNYRNPGFRRAATKETSNAPLHRGDH